MHLHHPSLSLNGRKKARHKFRNAEEAQRARQLESEWAELKKKYQVEEQARQSRRMKAETLTYTLTAPAGRVTARHIPSLDTGHAGAVASKAIPQYTGTKILGIGTMHKSNAVPIFSDEQAVDISKMRR
jgi:hypothetical protein